jgi:hypothetical protein
VKGSDLEQHLARLAEASEGIRARPGFTDQVMLAALASAAPSLAADLARSLRRVVPVALLAAALCVLWAVVSERSTDEAFAAGDETVELEW